MENYTSKTFGCKVNTYDTSLIQKKMDLLTPKTNNRYHIVNTCAVTEAAVLESLRWIRKYKKKHPEEKIIITGCAAQVELSRYKEAGEIDIIIANSHKSELLEIIKKYDEGLLKERVFHSNIFKVSDKGEGGQLEKSRTRFFLKIQDGCNSFCTFCVIPFARGKSRSLSASGLIHAVQKAESQGIREVVLTGVHIGDYKDPDTKKDLSFLVSEILKRTKIPRLRLSSLEPIEINPALFSLYQDERLCPHFHLSIQSASSKVLKSMKRKYTKKEVREILEKIHHFLPEAFVGMDVIAGFPAETQKDFEDTYKILNHSPWTKIHVFPYSPRPSTYALRMKGHSRARILRRAEQLRHLSDERFNEKARLQIGKIKSVLPLQKEALSRDYWPVHWERHWEGKKRSEVRVRLLDWMQETKKFKACLV